MGGVIRTENVCECFFVCGGVVVSQKRRPLFGLELIRPKLETQIFDSKIFFLFFCNFCKSRLRLYSWMEGSYVLCVKLCVCVSKQREGYSVCV